jgi:hypothetical protein
LAVLNLKDRSKIWLEKKDSVELYYPYSRPFFTCFYCHRGSQKDQFHVLVPASKLPGPSQICHHAYSGDEGGTCSHPAVRRRPSVAARAHRRAATGGHSFPTAGGAGVVQEQLEALQRNAHTPSAIKDRNGAEQNASKLKWHAFHPAILAWSTAAARSSSVASTTLSRSSSSYCAQHAKPITACFFVPSSH